VRKAQLRRAGTKNGDAQITRFHYHVSHYRVIRDVLPGVSPISIHWRHTKLERVSHFKTHPRCTLSVYVTNLVTDWAPMALT
jgi:hypothetical protein